MNRATRRDDPDTWHHVMNRGIARRTVFETLRDVRFFLSKVAQAVRRGEIEVHCYSILTTHFHLLIRSMTGKLSAAMRRIQNEYVRYFNRNRRRDGPLFRGRFVSCFVDSNDYLFHLVRYIDQNAPEARLSCMAEEYPHCSAFHYARQSGPPWLTRSMIEKAACEEQGIATYSPDAYRARFAAPISDALVELVQCRLGKQTRGPDPLNDLIGVTHNKVRTWMENRAAVADGTTPFCPVTSSRTIDECVKRLRNDNQNWLLSGSRKHLDLWQVVRAGLFRDACGLPFREISTHLKVSETTAKSYYHQHQVAIARDEAYSLLSSSVLSLVLEEQFS